MTGGPGGAANGRTRGLLRMVVSGNTGMCRRAGELTSHSLQNFTTCRCAGEPEAAAALCRAGGGHLPPARHPGTHPGLGRNPLPPGLSGVVCGQEGGDPGQAVRCEAVDTNDLPPHPTPFPTPAAPGLQQRALWQPLRAGGRLTQQGGDVPRRGRAGAGGRQPTLRGGVRRGGPARPALRLGRRLPLGQHAGRALPPAHHARARLGGSGAGAARPQPPPGPGGVAGGRRRARAVAETGSDTTSVMDARALTRHMPSTDPGPRLLTLPPWRYKTRYPCPVHSEIRHWSRGTGRMRVQQGASTVG